MCKGIGCELKDICFRSKAEVGTYQSWFMTSPNDGLECDYFWEIKKDKL